MLQFERGEVVDETYLRFPRQTDELPVPIDDPLAEVLRGNIQFLKYFACFEAHLANRGMLLEAGAFVQKAVQIKQPFGKCRGVMRIGVHDLVVISWNRRGS